MDTAAGTQCILSGHGGGGAGLTSELTENILHVFVNGAHGCTQNSGDIGVAFTLGDPPKDFGFAGGEAKFEERGRVGGGGFFFKDEEG